MILICSEKFFNINIFTLVIINFPSFIAFVVIGIIFLRHFLKKTSKINTITNKDYNGLKYLIPPIIPIIFYIIIATEIGFIYILNHPSADMLQGFFKGFFYITNYQKSIF